MFFLPARINIYIWKLFLVILGGGQLNHGPAGFFRGKGSREVLRVDSSQEFLWKYMSFFCDITLDFMAPTHTNTCHEKTTNHNKII